MANTGNSPQLKGCRFAVQRRALKIPISFYPQQVKGWFQLSFSSKCHQKPWPLPSGLIPHFTHWLLVKEINKQSLMRQLAESYWKPTCSFVFRCAIKTLQEPHFRLSSHGSIPCLVSHKATIKGLPGLDSHLDSIREIIHFQAHLDCWQNSFPWGPWFLAGSSLEPHKGLSAVPCHMDFSNMAA